MLEALRLDLQQSIRQLWKRPVFVLVTVTTLGLGVGANAAIFSVIEGVLLRPLPFPEPDRVVSVWTTREERGQLRNGMSLHDFEDWREAEAPFEAIAVFNRGAANLDGMSTAQRVAYAQISPSMFDVMGVRPAQGRAFLPEENQPGRADVVVLGHAFWRDQLGADPSAVGNSLLLDGRTVTVVGVMPEAWVFPGGDVAVLLPFGMSSEQEGSRGGRWVAGLARLRPGDAVPTAQAGMDRIAANLAEQYPETNRGVGVFVEPLHSSIVSDVRDSLLVLWGAVGLVLLIAGANIAGLLLARSADRSREFAVRSALGAGRSRLVAQILAESIPLSLLAGFFGVLIAMGGVRILTTLGENRIPRMVDVTLDGAVLAYSFVIALIAGVGFTLIPALLVARSDVAGRLRTGGRESAGRQRVMAREALVATQIALAVVVLIGAGLLVRTFTSLLDTDPGFDTSNVLTFRLSPSWTEIQDREQAARLYDDIVADLSILPGVAGVGAVNRLPLGGPWWATTITREGETEEAGNGGPAFTRVVTPGYLETIGLPLLRGRTPQSTDVAGADPVVAINRVMAETMWPGEDPIGKRFTMGGPIWYTIIGITGDERYSSLAQPTAPVMYIPFRQGRFGHFQDWGMSFVVRTTRDPSLLVPAVRERLTRLAPGVPVFQINTFESILRTDVADQRFSAALFGTFGLIALVLAAIGVYSLLSYIVGQRTREIGIRMALGAARPVILRAVLGRVLAFAVAGAGAGVAIALVTSRLLSSMLYGMAPRDPAAFGASVTLLLIVAAGACLVPAWRALRVEPVTALRLD